MTTQEHEDRAKVLVNSALGNIPKQLRLCTVPKPKWAEGDVGKTIRT